MNLFKQTMLPQSGHRSYILLPTIIILMLSGCAVQQPIPKTIHLEVRLPCIAADKVPVFPMLRTNAELAKLSDYDLILAINAQRLDVEQYAKEMAAVLIACTK